MCLSGAHTDAQPLCPDMSGILQRPLTNGSVMTRVLRAGVALVLLPVFLGSTALGAPTAAAAPPTVPVKKVVDGDTLDVRIGGRTERVRVIGVDTPEVGECYATEATRRLTALIAKRQVRLVADKTQPDRDRYKRLLRHVVLADGRSAAPLLIGGGFGWEFTYGKAYAGRAAFVRAESAAVKAKAGLWRGCPTYTRKVSDPKRKLTCAIKGNVSRRGDERIYHVPGQKYYAATQINPRKGERYFCTELQARKAGWRKSKE